MQNCLNDILIGASQRIKTEYTQAEILALRVLYAGEAGARASWLQYKALGFDIDTLYLADAAGILPSLGKRLGDLCPDDPWIGKLKGYYKHTWTKNQYCIEKYATFIEQMRINGIRSIVLNDLAAILQHYKNAGVRPISWQEILVKPEDYPQALIIARAIYKTDKPPSLNIVQTLPGRLHEHVWQNTIEIAMLGHTWQTLALPDWLMFNLLSIKYAKPNRTLWFMDTAGALSGCSNQGHLDHFKSNVINARLSLPILQAWSMFAKTAGAVQLDLTASAASQTLATMSIAPSEVVERLRHRMKRLF